MHKEGRNDPALRFGLPVMILPLPSVVVAEWPSTLQTCVVGLLTGSRIGQLALPGEVRSHRSRRR
jgi:hypothetical protein